MAEGSTKNMQLECPDFILRASTYSLSSIANGADVSIKKSNFSPSLSSYPVKNGKTYKPIGLAYFYSGQGALAMSYVHLDPNLSTYACGIHSFSSSTQSNKTLRIISYYAPSDTIKSYVSCSAANNIPKNIVMIKNGTSITGSLDAEESTMDDIYLVQTIDENENVVYQEYITVEDNGTYSWELINTVSRR